MKTKLFFGMLTAAATLAVTPAAFADEPTDGSVAGLTGDGSTDTYADSTDGGTYTTNTGSTTIGTVSKAYQRSITADPWTSASITTTGTVGGYKIKITGANDSGTYTTDQDLYFTGTSADHTDSLTITELEVENGETSSGGTYSTKKAFIVEGTTVILSGVTVEELGMSLVVGTEYGVGDATLVITDGSKVTTSAYYNNIGANLATGTITISEGSTLATQQITLGCGVNSLYAASPANAGEYWTKCFVDEDTYTEIKNSLFTDSYEGSYGIVNVESGSTFSVGVGNTDRSTNKFQLANGELNVSGAGSQMIIGQNSCFYLMGEQGFSTSSGDYNVMTGMYLTEKITVTGGGKIVAETDDEGNSATLTQVAIGDSWLASNTTVEILVSGKDENGNASTFDLTSDTKEHYDTVLIGTSSGYDETYGNGKMDGGTTSVTITASEEGVFRLGAAEGFYVCADNYEVYYDEEISDNDVGHSDGINVKLSAESGGSITLDAMYGSTVLLAAGSPAEDKKNTLTIIADGKSTDGTASSVTISGGDIYTNYGNDGTGGVGSVSVEITATNGGTIALKAETTTGQEDVGEAGTGLISFGKNTTITVEKESCLTTVGTVLFNEGASISVDATSTWKTESSVTFNAGSGLEIGAAAVADGTNDVSVALCVVTIANGADITVTIDISALENYTTASVAILTAESIILGTDDLTSSNVNELAANYFTADEKGYILDSWSWDNNTLYANIRTMPEPSMFGMLFGLSALGLVSTRRRRRKA